MVTAVVAKRRHGGRWRSVAQRFCASSETQDVLDEPVRKLGELLKLAVKAEAEGVPAADVARAEEQAKEFALFAGNGFREFGNGDQTLKRTYTNQELTDAGVDAESLLKIEDTTYGVRRGILSAIFFGGLALIVLFQPPAALVNAFGFAIIAAVAVDLLLNKGSLQVLVLDSVARIVNPDYRNRVAQHEAARFLVGYMIGVLPKAYTLSASDALSQYESPSMKAGCVFCSAKATLELESGKVSGKTLDQFVCIKLAGVAQEYLMFGQAQTGASNIEQIEDLFSALGFDKRRSTDQTRWAALNVVGLLRNHEEVHRKLAEAMKRGASTASCISLIESSLRSAKGEVKAELLV